jgi:hypothetical protein
MAAPAPQRMLAAFPDPEAIQAAYQDARTESPALHDDRIRISNAECRGIERGRFFCQVGYLKSGDEATDHLYFTVVTMARTDRGWRLEAGLCRNNSATR